MQRHINTGRKYAPHGQEISFVLPDVLPERDSEMDIQFCDWTRMVSGSMTINYLAGLDDPRSITAEALKRYDTGEYVSAPVTIDFPGTKAFCPFA